MKYTILTRKSVAIIEWMRKEYGSYEDHNESPTHVYALLKRFGGKVCFNEDELKTLIISGQYHSTSWDEDEIEGGITTMKTIANYVTKFKSAISNE